MGQGQGTNSDYGKKSFRNVGNLIPILVTDTPPKHFVSHPDGAKHAVYDYTTPRTVLVRMLVEGGRFRWPRAKDQNGIERCYGVRYVLASGNTDATVLAHEEFEYHETDSHVVQGAEGVTLCVTPRVASTGELIPWLPEIPPVGVLALNLPEQAGELMQLLQDTGCSNVTEAHGLPLPAQSSSKTFVVEDPLYTSNIVNLEGHYATACTHYCDTVLANDDDAKIALADYLRQLERKPATARVGNKGQQANEADQLLTALRTQNPTRFYNIFIRPDEEAFVGRALLYLGQRCGLVQHKDGAYSYRNYEDATGEYVPLGRNEESAILAIQKEKAHVRAHLYERTAVAHLEAKLNGKEAQEMLSKARKAVREKEKNTAVPTTVQVMQPRLVGTPGVDLIPAATAKTETPSGLEAIVAELAKTQQEQIKAQQEQTNAILKLAEAISKPAPEAKNAKVPTKREQPKA